MPQETSPWKQRELKRERPEPAVRWRASPSYHGCPRFFPRANDPHRPTGRGKQGGWHLYLEDPGRKFVPSRSFSKMVDMRGDGRHSRAYRDNRGLPAQSQGEYHEGQLWETSRGSFSFKQKLSDYDDNLRDQHHKRGANWSSPSRKFEDRRVVDSVDRELRRSKHPGSPPSRGPGLGHYKSRGNWSIPSRKIEDKRLVDSVDREIRRRKRPGSSPSRGPGLGHFSNSKSARCIDLAQRKVESHPKSVIHCNPSPENADCGFLTGQSEEVTSKKKPRLGWGEGLAKYENKKVEDPADNMLERAADSNQLVCSDGADRTSGYWGVLDNSSTATGSSLASDSISDTEDKLLESLKMSVHVDNISDLPVSISQTSHEGSSTDLNKFDLGSFSSVDPSFARLLDSNYISLDSGSAAALNKLQHLKEDVLKALMMTESEIDLLENEVAPKSRVLCASSIPSSFKVKDHGTCTGQDDGTTITLRSAPLQVVCRGDTGFKEICYLKGTRADSCITATLDKSVEDTNVVSENDGRSPVIETVKAVSGSRREETSGYAEESALCDMILSSNKECASRASSDVFNNMSMRGYDKLGLAKIGDLCRWRDDSRIREKFIQRRQFSMLKEVVLAFKFKALHHLWQKDLRTISLRNSRTKAKKKLESGLRIKLGGCRKPRSKIAPRLSSGMISPVQNKEIIRYASKLPTDFPQRICREALKMPAQILDEPEKIASMFISHNGLVEDPCAVEKERMMINPWTAEEKEIFLEKLGMYGKDFRKISSFLDHKTTADCVEFYYKNHKSEVLPGVKKNRDARLQPKLLSADTCLVTSRKIRNCEVNAVSLNLLGEACLEASRDQTDAGNNKSNLGGGQVRFFLRPCSSSTLARVDTLNDEREVVAADVLTEIRSSVAHVKSFGEERFGLELIPGTAGKLLNAAPEAGGDDIDDADANGGGDDTDGPGDVNCTHVCEDNSIADKNQDVPVSLKTETSDAIDCGLSTNPKWAGDGSCPNGSRVSGGGLRIMPKGFDVLPEMDLNDQISDQSLGATKRCSANLGAESAAESSPCSVFSLSSESKDQWSTEADQDDNPPQAISSASASFQGESHNSSDQPGRREQSGHGYEGKVQSLLEFEKPTLNGDFKLFGTRIPTGAPSQRNPDLNIEGEVKEGIPKATLNLTVCSERSSTMSSAKFNYAGLENIPIRSYGCWDGSRVRTDSAFLLAKYPTAFSKHPLPDIAKGSEVNLDNPNSHLVIPAWDVNVKKRVNAYLEEMQRCNGLEAISGQKQQGGTGMDGMSSGARGMLAGGSRTDLSDPAAVLKMHYARSNQFWGQGVSLTREDSQRDAAEMKARASFL